MLDRLVPSLNGADMVCAAEHDEVYLETNVKELEKVITDADILTLVRCGVRYDDTFDCLAMFV